MANSITPFIPTTETSSASGGVVMTSKSFNISGATVPDGGSDYNQIQVTIPAHTILYGVSTNSIRLTHDTISQSYYSTFSVEFSSTSGTNAGIGVFSDRFQFLQSSHTISAHAAVYNLFSYSGSLSSIFSDNTRTMYIWWNLTTTHAQVVVPTVSGRAWFVTLDV